MHILIMLKYGKCYLGKLFHHFFYNEPCMTVCMCAQLKMGVDVRGRRETQHG